MTSVSILIYIVFLIGFIIFSYLGIYHLKRFGYKEDACSTMIFIYTFLTVVIVAGSIFLILISDLGQGLENFGIMF